jgi:NEDD8-activating enzyme E1 regulatory subunit
LIQQRELRQGVGSQDPRAETQRGANKTASSNPPRQTTNQPTYKKDNHNNNNNKSKQQRYFYYKMATTDKYDRQLRLWGASGQRSLAETCIVLIRATAAGTETLKNLVLPGIGAFCIVDDVHMTTMSSNNNAPNTEFTSNFFLTAAVDGDNTTMSRAQMATEYLQELNSDVKGSYHDISSSSSMDGAALLQFVLSTSSSSSNSGSIDSLVSLIQDQILINSSSETMKIKSILVVASDLEPNLLLATSRTCDKNAWPLLAVHSYGLMGIVRCQVSESCLLPLFHTKRSSPPDLRLTALCATPSQQEHQQQQQQQQQQPSPLQLHMQEMYNTVGDWDQMTSQQHGHVPYPLILMKIQRQWLASNATLPSSFAEKQAFQAMVQQSARDFGNELNFQEAHRNAYLAYNVDGGGGNVDTSHLQFLIKILKEALGLDTESLNSGNSSGISFDDGPGEQQQQQKTQLQFLIMLEALQEFLTLHHGQAPLQGTIPDMTASTDLYVQLQNIYRNQAQRDLQEMRRLCVAKQQQLQQLQQQRNMAAAAAAGIPAIVTVVSDDRDVAEAAAAVNSNSNISSIVADEDLSTFCQNVQFLDIFQTRTLIQEYNVIDEDDEYKNNNNINIKDVSGYDDDFEDICQDLSMACLEVAGNDDDDDDEDGDENNCSASDERPDMFPLFWYLGFRACQLFHQRHGRYPGTVADSDDKKYLQDIPLLQACLEKAVQAYQLQDLPVVKKVLLTDAEYKVVTELTRYAQAEIHTIASVVGGVASQEAVKLITGQYVPLHHTYVYNGIASTGGVYKF